jgi:hypothetical protein
VNRDRAVWFGFFALVLIGIVMLYVVMFRFTWLILKWGLWLAFFPFSFFGRYWLRRRRGAYSYARATFRY